MTEPYSPRKNDELVEPLYAGLEVGETQTSRGAKRNWVWVVLLALGLTAVLVFW